MWIPLSPMKERGENVLCGIGRILLIIIPSSKLDTFKYTRGLMDILVVKWDGWGEGGMLMRMLWVFAWQLDACAARGDSASAAPRRVKFLRQKVETKNFATFYDLAVYCKSVTCPSNPPPIGQKSDSFGFLIAHPSARERSFGLCARAQGSKV